MSRVRREGWVAAAIGTAVIAVAACMDLADRRVTPGPQATALPSGIVRVRIAGETLGCRGAFVVVDGRGEERLAGTRISDGSSVRIEGDAVRVGALALGPPPVEIRPIGSALIEIEGRPYRGSLRIERSGSKGLRLMNRVDVEDYVLGVVPGEMPSSFGLEALKAQAVAARSYALAECDARGWVYADTRSQMYGGVAAEAPLATRAVRETTGEVLTHEGQVLTAWYHSTCGGRTAKAASVFPQAPVDVMDREVPCSDCRSSPIYSWERRFPSARVCSVAGIASASLRSVETTPVVYPGRPERVTVRTGSAEAAVDAVTLRDKLSRGVSLSEQLPSTRFTSAPRIDRGELLVSGRGWGHGVGLCQYGAGGFGGRGATYRAILSRYYPGAELDRLP